MADNSLDWLAKRTVATLKHEGYASVLLRAAAFVGYKIGIWSVGWYARELDQPITQVEPGLDAAVCKLAKQDVDDYLRFHSNVSRSEYLRRLDEQHICFAARDNAGSIASVTWTATNHVWIDFVGRDVQLDAGDVYLYDSYTSPQFRGKRLQPFLCARILLELCELGYTRAIVIIAPENRSNIASRKRSGFAKIGTTVRAKIGRFCRDYFWAIKANQGGS